MKASEPVITCQCIRVPVLDGHTAAAFVKFRKKPTKEQLIESWLISRDFRRNWSLSAPKQFIQYLEEDNRPQVQLDVNYEKGMGVSVGRLREDKVYDLSQSRRLPLLQGVSNSKSFSVEALSPTEINAPRGCAVILRRICQISLTRITHQVSRT